MVEYLELHQDVRKILATSMNATNDTAQTLYRDHMFDDLAERDARDFVFRHLPPDTRRVFIHFSW